MNGENGSVMIGVALVVVVAVMLVGVASAGSIVAARSVAESAADAAALAAAPVTFRPFGARGTATQEAARLARVNGTRLVACSCTHDRSWVSRTVSVTVIRRVRTPWGSVFDVQATSRATFDPARLLVDPSPQT